MSGRFTKPGVSALLELSYTLQVLSCSKQLWVKVMLFLLFARVGFQKGVLTTLGVPTREITGQKPVLGNKEQRRTLNAACGHGLWGRVRGWW